MKVYMLMIEDRHTDPDAQVFTTPAKAVAAAEAYLVDIDRPDVEVEENPPGDWLFYARYSVEGDCVWIVERELR
jgi:hypothetical protein